MFAAATRPGLRRLMTAVLRNEGDIVKGGGSFSKKERAIEDQYIHNKEVDLANKAAGKKPATPAAPAAAADKAKPAKAAPKKK